MSERICKVCKQELDYSKPDPCLGMLPGVNGACCGHGRPDGGHIGFENGMTVYFDTLEILDWSNRDEIEPDPVTGGLWSSSALSQVVFRNTYTGYWSKIKRFVKQILHIY